MVLSLIEMMSILLCALWDSLCLLGRHICFCLGPFYCLGCLFCFFELHKLFLCFGHEFLVGMFDCEYIFSFSELSFSFVEGFLFYANVSGRLGPVFFFYFGLMFHYSKIWISCDECQSVSCVYFPQECHVYGVGEYSNFILVFIVRGTHTLFFRGAVSNFHSQHQRRRVPFSPSVYSAWCW